MKEVEAIEVHDFSDKEKQWITAMVGVCSVCGCAAYLGNAWVALGLVPVAVIVWAMREPKPEAKTKILHHPSQLSDRSRKIMAQVVLEEIQKAGGQWPEHYNK